MKLPTSSSFVKAATASLALHASSAFAVPAVVPPSPEVGALSPANSARDISSYSSIPSVNSGKELTAAIEVSSVPPSGTSQVAGREPAIRPGSGGRRSLRKSLAHFTP